MKGSIVRVMCAAALVLGLSAAAHAQDHRCTNPGLEGSWAYTETGWVVTPATPPATLAVAAVGKYTFDAAGTFTGSQYASTEGMGIGYDTKDGTYVLNEDCTATLTINGYRGGVLVRKSVWQIVLADNATEMRGISVSLEALVPTPGGPVWVPFQPVMTLTGKRLARDRGNDQQ